MACKLSERSGRRLHLSGPGRLWWVLARGPARSCGAWGHSHHLRRDLRTTFTTILLTQAISGTTLRFTRVHLQVQRVWGLVCNSPVSSSEQWPLNAGKAPVLVLSMTLHLGPPCCCCPGCWSPACPAQPERAACAGQLTPPQAAMWQGGVFTPRSGLRNPACRAWAQLYGSTHSWRFKSWPLTPV